MISKLFWRKKTIQVQEDGLIRFSVDRCKYEFQIYDPVTFFSAQSSQIKVYFDERNLSHVHIFDSVNRFMGSVEPRMVYDGSNPEIIKQHREKRKLINKYRNEQKRKWERGAALQSNKVVWTQFHDYLLDETDQARELFLQLNQDSSNNKTPILL